MRRSGATLRCGAWASHCGGFSCCGARALGAQASVVVAHRLSSCGWRALERRLSSCGAWASLLRGMWDLPRPGLGPMSPALAGRFLSIAPRGKPQLKTFLDLLYMPGSVLSTFSVLSNNLTAATLREKLQLREVK